MKSGKAPGDDRVSADMLKAGGEIIVRPLVELFEGIWEKEDIPSDWKTGLIIKLPKKGDLRMCNNRRGITLLPVTSKGFSRVIRDRISAAIDAQRTGRLSERKILRGPYLKLACYPIVMC